MVKPVKQRFEDSLDREEIGDKTREGIDRALQPQFDPVGMPMQSSAAMRFANIRQKMRGLETEGL